MNGTVTLSVDELSGMPDNLFFGGGFCYSLRSNQKGGGVGGTRIDFWMYARMLPEIYENRRTVALAAGKVPPTMPAVPDPNAPLRIEIKQDGMRIKTFAPFEGPADGAASAGDRSSLIAKGSSFNVGFGKLTGGLSTGPATLETAVTEADKMAAKFMKIGHRFMTLVVRSAVVSAIGASRPTEIGVEPYNFVIPLGIETPSFLYQLNAPNSAAMLARYPQTKNLAPSSHTLNPANIGALWEADKTGFFRKFAPGAILRSYQLAGAKMENPVAYLNLRFAMLDYRVVASPNADTTQVFVPESLVENYLANSISEHKIDPRIPGNGVKFVNLLAPGADGTAVMQKVYILRPWQVFGALKKGVKGFPPACVCSAYYSWEIFIGAVSALRTPIARILFQGFEVRSAAGGEVDFGCGEAPEAAAAGDASGAVEFC